MIFSVLLGENAKTLLVGFNLRNEAVEECLFTASRGIVGTNGCNIDMLYWLVPLFGYLSKVAKSAIDIESLLGATSISHLLSFLGVFVHINTSYMLRESSRLSATPTSSAHSTDESEKTEKKEETEETKIFEKEIIENAEPCIGSSNHCWKVDFRFLYALNPIIIIACTASPVPSLVHLLIVNSNYCALKGWSIPLYLCLSLLVAGHAGFLSVVPAYYLLLRTTLKDRRGKTVHAKDCKTSYITKRSTNLVELIFIPGLIVYFAQYSFSSDYCPMNGTIYETVACLSTAAISSVHQISSCIKSELFRERKLNFEPSAGIIWYLDAQVFGRLSDYFSLLISTQPYIFAIPLLLRLSELRPLHTVRQHLSTYHYILCLLFIYDVFFLLRSFCSHVLFFIIESIFLLVKYFVGKSYRGDNLLFPPRNFFYGYYLFGVIVLRLSQ